MRGRVGHGTCSSCGDRRLPKAVRSRYYASARGRPPLHGNVLDSFDTGCWAITYLRREVSRFIANESSSQGRHADRRAGAWLQEVEQICDPEALALTIGRTNCASLAEDQKEIVALRIKGKGSIFQHVPVTGCLSAALLEWKGNQESFKGKRILAPGGIAF